MLRWVLRRGAELPMDLSLRLERMAFAAWPAEEVLDLQGWRLRFMKGVSRRANSVWPIAAEGDMPLEERIDRVEGWYAERGVPPMFQVSGAARPDRLDEALAGRGYRREAPVSVQIAAAARVEKAAPNAIRVNVEGALTDAWFDVSGRRGRFAAVAETYRGLLARIGDRACFALAEADGQAVGVGLGVVDGAWMGVFSMLTLGPSRRRGVGRAVLAALARCARDRGCERMYLLVERDNAPARALYRAASFEEASGYHYRVR